MADREFTWIMTYCDDSKRHIKQTTHARNIIVKGFSEVSDAHIIGLLKRLLVTEVMPKGVTLVFLDVFVDSSNNPEYEKDLRRLIKEMKFE